MIQQAFRQTDCIQTNSTFYK